MDLRGDSRCRRSDYGHAKSRRHILVNFQRQKPKPRSGRKTRSAIYPGAAWLSDPYLGGPSATAQKQRTLRQSIPEVLGIPLARRARSGCPCRRCNGRERPGEKAARCYLPPNKAAQCPQERDWGGRPGPRRYRARESECPAEKFYRTEAKASPRPGWRL